MNLNGIIPINKPRLLSSVDVARALTRKFGKHKLGHVGTLDPAASGVLPILVGKATCFQDYLLAMPKSYLFSIQFGVTSDSLDLETPVSPTVSTPPNIKSEEIQKILVRFCGKQLQIPPLYSAIKYQGKRLCDYAREASSQDGAKKPAPSPNDFARMVEIFSLILVSSSGDSAEFLVHCSKGTYVRSLGRDIAEALGTTAVITSITRTQAAGINLSKTFTLEEILAAHQLSNYVIPTESMVLPMPKYIVREQVEHKRLMAGQKLLVPYDCFATPVGTDSSTDVTHRSDLALLIHDGASFGIGQIFGRAQDNIEIKLLRGWSS